MNGWVLQVSAGTGPVEVRRFVAMLAEHLTEACVEAGAPVRDVAVHGDVAAPSSVEIHLGAAPPAILALVGTHALVARSPDRGRRSRKRWYAGVRIHDAPGDGAERVVDPRDVAITAMRAGGPGGQHVNKTSSAVRVEHRPSGLTVRVADERSQRENVRIALARLASILGAQAEERVRRGEGERRLAHHRVERGRPAFIYETGPKGGLVPCAGTCSR